MKDIAVFGFRDSLVGQVLNMLPPKINKKIKFFITDEVLTPININLEHEKEIILCKIRISVPSEKEIWKQYLLQLALKKIFLNLFLILTPLKQTPKIFQNPLFLKTINITP